MKKIKKIITVIERELIKKLIYVNEATYMKYYIRYLKKIGVRIKGTPKYISPDVYIDGKDYSLITIDDNVTISREVMLLTHDYSLTNAVSSRKQIIRRGNGELYTLGEIVIGKNAFIGARASLLPGSIIGEGAIVGAGAVVKGKVESGTIVIGNPAKRIATTGLYSEKIIRSGNYFSNKVK